MKKNHTRRDFAALAVAVAVFASVLLGIAACGDEDLFFPGEIPATATEDPTETPDPDEDDS